MMMGKAKNASQQLYFAVLTLMMMGKAKNAQQNIKFVFCCFNPNPHTLLFILNRYWQ
jgi:hypothetical protein